MKDYKYIVFFVFVLMLNCYSVNSQISDVKQLTVRQLKKFGESSERVGDYYSAIFFYEEYQDRRKNNNNVNYKLAELYRITRNYESAKDLYFKVSVKASKKYPKSLFYYAQMLKSTGNYIEAIDAFKDFKRVNKGDKDEKTYSKLVKNEIAGCDSALLIIKQPLKISIDNLGSSVNSRHVDFSPISYDDSTLIYASLRIDSLIYFNNDNIDKIIPTRRFYIAKKEGMDWTGGHPFKAPFNADGFETGNGALSRDGKRFYYTRCTKNWQNKFICEIYVSHKKGKEWLPPVKLPPIINDPRYTSTQPTIGTTAKYNREVIYFVSDRPNGRGGSDLWYTVWNDNKNQYSEPKNLGSKINTPGDEMTPYYEPLSRTLYYSSTGLPGIGGLDIFYTMGERGKWTTIKNIGYPLNSSYDDLYFTVSKNREDGFLVSNRPGGSAFENQTCCDDIYYYRWLEFIRLYVTGQIYPIEKDRFGRKRDFSNFDFMNPDEFTLPLEKAVIAMYMVDEESGDLIFMERDTTGKDGRYIFTLLPEKNYEFKMEGFQYFEDKVYLSTEFINFSDSIEMPPIWVNVMTDKPIVLNNIYYDFNMSDLKNEAKNVLDTTLLILLREAPEFIIEIGAHTDSIGDFKYNKELSQERANNVVSYLISKGIPPERLIAKGYGADKPIAPNFLPDGSDNPAGREKNRRTEFRIVGTLDEMGEDEFDEDF